MEPFFAEHTDTDMNRLTDWCPERGLPFILAVAALGACAAPSSEMTQRMDSSDAEIREEIEALKRAVESSYDRERALAERLQRLEEGVAQQEPRPETPIDPAANEPQPVPSSPGSGSFDVQAAYDRAYQLFNELNYEAAFSGFGEIVSRAPNSEWSDNARYWMGACQYGLGKYRPALAEFTKVFTYMETEKADDAQLKIARCYLALGEKENALSAFRKLLDEYPDSEYVGTARMEMRYLEGP